MAHRYLSWISDSNLKEAVIYLLKKAEEAKQDAEKNFGKNVIDPFSAIFEMSGFEMNYSAWIKSETARQAQKTLQNHIGTLHQSILGSAKGWDNLETGNVIDIVSKGKKIIAEIKNKHNTISGGDLADLYYSLDSVIMPKTSIYKGYTAYYVPVIPKKPARYDKLFTPSDKKTTGKCPANEKIREIDGASFYHLVTGVPNALEQLYDVLPIIIAEITKKEIKSFGKIKKFFKAAYNSELSVSSHKTVPK